MRITFLLAVFVAVVLVGAPLHAACTFGFLPPSVYAAGAKPAQLATGDFNHDQRVDLVVMNGVGNVAILLATADGNFATPVTIADETSTDLLAADFNHDGHLDVVLAAEQHLRMLRGNGDGTFTAIANDEQTVSGNPSRLVSGDFDDDGWIDVAAVTADGGLSVMRNVDGTLVENAHHATAEGLGAGLAIGDFDRDGHDDLAVSNRGAEAAYLFFNAGDGTFVHGSSTIAVAAPTDLAAGDFDEDGDDDLAIVAADGSALATAMSDGAARTFATPATYGGLTHGNEAIVEDLDGDGHRDVAITSENGLTLYRGNGNGTFGSPQSFGSHTNIGVAIADLDRDGGPDVVMTAPREGQVEILQNACAQVSLSMTSNRNPATQAQGFHITIRVSSPPAVKATGTFTIKESSTTYSTGDISKYSEYGITYTGPNPRTYTYRVEYSGDSRFAATTRKLDQIVTLTPFGAPSGLYGFYLGEFVVLNWQRVADAHHYEIWRNTGAGWSVINTAPGNATTYVDSTARVDYPVLYRLRAIAADGTMSPFSDSELVLLFRFTDPQLQERVTPVKLVHLTELRMVTNKLRALASLAPMEWAEPTPQLIRASHLTELRQATDEARLALNLGTFILPFFPPAPGRPISLYDFTDARHALQCGMRCSEERSHFPATSGALQ